MTLTANALARLGMDFFFWDQQQVSKSTCFVQSNEMGLSGYLEGPDGRVALEEVVGAYTRLASWAALPELQQRHADDPRVIHACKTHCALEEWLELTPARVVNRTYANASNNSKPYQALLIRRRFYIPETLVSSDSETILAFCEQHPRTIVKSISGERSIVTEFTRRDRDRLSLLKHCPIQVQEWVDGFDVRVHVAGRHVFATRVHSAAIDYRYDRSPQGAQFNSFELPDDVEDACVRLTEEMDLGLAGLDLRFSPDGRVYCFEVNPSPAYSVFESATGQQISHAIALHLAGL
ncbi:MAG: hypothetical protein KF682_01565 [Nitrospira sp.]|nr:hypothetical protein [Nitrospira sp.]